MSLLALDTYPTRTVSIDTNGRLALLVSVIGLLATVTLALAGVDMASIGEALAR